MGYVGWLGVTEINCLVPLHSLLYNAPDRRGMGYVGWLGVTELNCLVPLHSLLYSAPDRRGMGYVGWLGVTELKMSLGISQSCTQKTQQNDSKKKKLNRSCVSLKKADRKATQGMQ
jgi:hypothetical protein